MYHFWSLAKAGMGFFLGLALSMLLIFLWGGYYPQSPAVELLDVDYTLQSVCPGDEIPYGLHLRVNRDESHLYKSESYLREHDGSGGTIQFGTMPDAGLSGIPDAIEIIDNDPTFIVPNFPAGDYAMVQTIGTFSEDSKPTMALFPFTIPNDCRN